MFEMFVKQFPQRLSLQQVLFVHVIHDFHSRLNDFPKEKCKIDKKPNFFIYFFFTFVPPINSTYTYEYLRGWYYYVYIAFPPSIF